VLRRVISHPKAAIVVGAALGIATTAAYLIGSGRSFGYDAAATFGNFVATPNLIDAFAVHSAMPSMPLKSIASNDHVFLSLISHLIYSLTGSRSEAVYRLVPALAAGGSVAVSATVLARRFGLLAGVCAGIFIATNPMFVENSRDLRGYSLAALLALLATMVLLASPRSGEVGARSASGGEWRSSSWTRGRLVAYALLLGLAIATHVFVIVVLAGHVVWIAMRRSRRDIKRLLPAWVAAFAIGLAANANIEIMEFVQHGFPPSMFNPAFPLYLVLFLLGAPAVVPLGLWLSTAGLGLWAARREARVWAAIAVVALVVAILWLVLQPAYLYPRFFIFLIPGVAYLMAAAIKRWWVLAPVVVAGAIIAIVAQAPGYTEDPLALPQAANAVGQARAAGGNPCVLHSDESIMAAYTTAFTVVTTADQLGACSEVVIVSWNVDPTLRDLAAQQFPRLTVLPAYYHAVVLER
jgi:4-amino-4-deoxy-L-arabinose transferase-like glycosyltransferase